LARRAELNATKPQRSWIQQGVAVLGVSVLGLGVAGSVAMTGNAQHVSTSSTEQHAAASSATAAPAVSTSVEPGVKAPTAFDRREQSVSRSNFRPALGSAAVDRRAGQRADLLMSAGERAQQSAQGKAVQKREKSLDKAARAAQKKAKELKAEAAEEKRQAKAKRERAKKAKRERAKKAEQANRASMPVSSGYRIAARFGDTGSWSRYHTGIDFSAPMGTTIRAAAGGVVTHAGSGSESWAGNYVTIKHSDGKSTLYAHMSTVSVDVGEQVSGGTRVGAIGMTGRTFGPHVHVELYPADVKPGDPYEAINPAPWLHDHGLKL
jgi:murein DD-endopeptidase MepM/ murein hydrolase activator NlpD